MPKVISKQYIDENKRDIVISFYVSYDERIFIPKKKISKRYVKIVDAIKPYLLSCDLVDFGNNVEIIGLVEVKELWNGYDMNLIMDMENLKALKGE